MTHRHSADLNLAAAAGATLRTHAFDPEPEPIQIQIDDRRRVQRQHLADHQAADDGDAERSAQLRAGAAAERQRQRAQQRRHRGHHDRPEAQQAGLVDRLVRGLALRPLRLQREVDHHDGVLLHDADQQNDADHRDDGELGLEEQQRQQRAHAGRRQRRENRDRDGCSFRTGCPARCRRSPARRGSARAGSTATPGRPARCPGSFPRTVAGMPISRSGVLDRAHRVAQRHAGRQVERQRDRRELALVIHRQRVAGRLVAT